MSEQERPPTSGAGSGVGAWREYAAAVTDSPVESWESLSRDEIVELLDSEGPPVRKRPVWMVPTDDGMVPESSLRKR